MIYICDETVPQRQEGRVMRQSERVLEHIRNNYQVKSDDGLSGY